MNITFTEKALEKITMKIQDKNGYIKLKYDTDGCGCAVSGVAVLWFVKELDWDDDQKVETNGYPVYVEKSKEVFFDEDMIIDFAESANCFQLKSMQQYLNPRMSFIIK